MGPKTINEKETIIKIIFTSFLGITKWKGVITIWDYPKVDTETGSAHSWINRRVKEFEKLYPGTYIDYRTIDSATGKLTLRAASKIGACPDIAPIGSDMYFISSGLLEPLNEYVGKEDFLEDALSSCMYNDTLYGIPWAKMGYTLLLNKDIFEDRKVELPIEGSWTYEEFLESLKKLTVISTRKAGSSVYGLVSSLETGHYNLYGMLLYGCELTKTEESCNSIFDDAVTGLLKLSELKNVHKVMYPEVTNINNNQAFNLFLAGKAAVFLGDAWMVPYLKGFGIKYGMNFTTAHYPSKNKTVSPYINDIYYSYGVFKQDDEMKKEACIEFIKFLTEERFQEDLKKFGYFPVRKSANYIYQTDKELYTIQRGLESAKHIADNKYWWEIDEIFRYAISDALNGNKSPEEALSEAKQLTTKYLDN